MPRMDLRVEAMTVVAAGAIACAIAGCGGGGAKSPGMCPDGTVLKGSDCVPDDSSASGGDGSSGASAASGSGSSPASSGGAASSGGDDTSGGGSGSAGDGASAPASGATPYDKDAVEVQLKRGARQVKSACGAATDDDGHATGPWGPAKVSIVLGRNGHVKQVTVPSPYDGKPVGICITHAFQKIQFPPYAAPSDSVVDWDVDVVKPK